MEEPIQPCPKQQLERLTKKQYYKHSFLLKVRNRQWNYNKYNKRDFYLSYCSL